MSPDRARPRSAALIGGLALVLGVLHPFAIAAEPGPAPATPKLVVAGHYRGMLGTLEIDLTLTEDTDAEDSVHGWYRVLAPKGPSHVLLAGEFEDQALSMEESENGVDVSGTWNAIIDAEGISGQWSDVNGEHPRDFKLKRIADKIKGKH
jgi:hypothetical protein